MQLTGRVIKGRNILFSKSVADACPESSGFRDRLEDCLLSLCKEADISTPMWLSKNTVEIANFGKTSFYADQFAENVIFDRFEIKINDK